MGEIIVYLIIYTLITCFYDAMIVRKVQLNRIKLKRLYSSASKSSLDIDSNNSNLQSEIGLITSRSKDYSAWYNDVITAADMVDSSPVRGCMVIKPWGMGVWDLIHTEMDQRIKECLLSTIYSKIILVKGSGTCGWFAKECAIVTHHRLCKSPDGNSLIPDPEAELEEPLIVRPTSETIIWNMFSKWIQSHRDLPLKVNQWANVVRWELRTRPFLRSTEFLWQEGHTAHASAEEALATARESLDMYASFCEEFLAIPCVKGRKSPSERFAGAEETFTIEALMQNGWALQSGTSHFLGQNFAKAFDVYFQTESSSRELVWATSWGVSTRLIGAMVMTHSDDNGLVLPPRVAPVQVVIVPITKGKGDDHDKVMERVREIQTALQTANIRVKVDDRNYIRPGAKYFEWERKGLPIRLDIGPRDLSKGSSQITIRNKLGEKASVDLAQNVLTQQIMKALDDMNSSLLESAKSRLERKTFRINTYDEMVAMINSDKDEDKGFYLVPWKCNAQNEEVIKTNCKATIRCYPDALNNDLPPKGLKCFYSGEPATHMALFARAF